MHGRLTYRFHFMESQVMGRKWTGYTRRWTRVPLPTRWPANEFFPEGPCADCTRSWQRHGFSTLWMKSRKTVCALTWIAISGQAQALLITVPWLNIFYIGEDGAIRSSLSMRLVFDWTASKKCRYPCSWTYSDNQ